MAFASDNRGTRLSGGSHALLPFLCAPLRAVHRTMQPQQGAEQPESKGFG
ncbi:hypothetical protein OCAR_5910 [Afipia carboxidovorans OM5]|nr:hypothetical protein OCAR_5910 [Afipia carboxidovorans OM5]